MRPSLPLAIGLAWAGVLSAQNPINQFEFFPDPAYASTNAATRVGSGSADDVECLAEIPSAVFRNVGAGACGVCQGRGLRYLIQDQLAITQDQYTVVLRKPVAANGLPDASAAGILLKTAPLTLPPPPAGWPNPGIAWVITATFSSPVTVPCADGFWMGLGLLPGASASDYTLVQTASAYSAGPPAVGDNPRTPAPVFHCGRIVFPAGTASRSTSQRTLAMSLITEAAVLNIGNVDSTKGGYVSYGLGGAYPSAARRDGLQARVLDLANANGTAHVVMALSFSPLPGGFCIGGVAGAVAIDPAVLIVVGSASIDATGAAVVPIVPAPPGVPAFVSGSVVFQGVSLGTALRLTNAQSVSF